MPDVMIQDAVVPRSRLPEVLADTYRISAKYNLMLANVFHAGDGNLHPLICFDLRRGADIENVRQAGREIMETCVRAGGSITGEHGVGLDKSAYLPLIFSDDDMDTMLRVRAAFDPSGLCNPGKIIPMPKGCGEARAVATAGVFPPVGEGEGLARGNLVPPPSLLPKVEGKTRAISVSTNLVAARMNEARVQRELSQRLGSVGVRRLPDFAFDLRDSRAERLIEVSPASAEQAAEVFDFAAREGLAAIPAGARHNIDTGNLMARADLIVTTRLMNHLVKHEPADLVATAEAGMTLSNFQKHLAESGQWLPIDPPDDGTVTLGGAVATAANGPHSLGYGPLRSFVIGMRVVLADGQRIKVGGNVVKNVAGYDLCKLFTGSFGTLGIITEVTFKLRPRPLEARTIVALGSHDALLMAGRRVANSFSPVAVEVLSPLLSQDVGLDSPRGSSTMMIRYAASSRAVVTQTAQTLKALRDEGLRCATYDDDAVHWQNLSSAPLQAQHDLVWRARMRPSDLPAFGHDVAALEGDVSHGQMRWHAGIGDGHLRVMAHSPAYHQEAIRALERLRQKAENLGGSLIVDRAPVEVKREFDSLGGLGSTADLMKRVKDELDPRRLLSPGRFF